MLQGIGGGLILAIVNFLMVFLVLGGLAGVLTGLKRLIHYWETRQSLDAAPSGQLGAGPAASLEAPQAQEEKKHLAAITAALHEFTSQPAGALRIDSIEPLAEVPVSQNQPLAVITAALHHYLEVPEGSLAIDSVTPMQTGTQADGQVLAAISAALHEYLATPEGSFRIVRIQPVGTMNTWKMAGRLDAMGFDNN